MVSGAIGDNMAKKLKIYNGSSWEDVTFAITPPSTNVTNSFTTNQVIDVSTSVAALRITQRGTGESFRVEDDTNPDASPFVITATGQVGMGTDAPDSALHISGSGDTAINITKTGQASWYLQSLNSGAFRLYSGTASAERIRVDSSGNVGIGSSSPQAILHVEKNVAAEMGAFLYNSNASGYAALRIGNSDRGTNGDHLIYGSSALGFRSKTGAAITFEPSGSEKMRLTTAGNLAVGMNDPIFRLQTYNDLTSPTVGAQALVFQAQVANGNNDYLKLYQERTVAATPSWGGTDWILRRHVDGSPMGGFRWAAGDWNPRAIYGTPDTPAIRTTHISTGSPSGGIDGDMWAVYV